MTTRKIRECAINDRRGRGEGLFRWGVCRSFNLFFQHVEGELLKKYLGNSGRLFPFAWIDVSFDPCRWLGARGRKAQPKLHLLMIFFRYLANWSDSTQKLAGLKFRDWRPCRPKAIDNFSHNRFVDRQLFGKSIISKFQSQKLAGLKFRELEGLKFRDWRPCRPKAKFENFSHNRFVDRKLFGEWIIFKFQYHKTF